MRLGFRSSFGELLPANKESVIIADKVAARLSTASTLTVVAHGSNTEGLQRFVQALVPELRKLPPELVGQVDDGVRDSRTFFDEHRFLYAPLDLLHEIHDEVKNRYDYEVNKAAGFLLAGDRFAEQDLVAIGRGGAHHTLVEDPAADVATFAELGGLGQSGKHVEPVAGFLDDGDLTAAIDDGDLGRVVVGRNVDLRDTHHDAALGGGKRERREGEHGGQERKAKLHYV
jgi:hypothetical protein